MRILVVDDDELVRNAVSRGLRMIDGVSVIQATDPADALDKIRINKPDAVLTDWDMPGGGGGAVSMGCYVLRIPCVVWSGRDIQGIPHLTKGSVSTAEIVTALEQAIANNRASDFPGQGAAVADEQPAALTTKQEQ